MEKVSLYRKYRPHNFDNLVGQDNIKTTLVNALKNNSVTHAYLFTGPRGTGKTSTARLLAKALNCVNLKDGYEPCNECEFCTALNNGSLIDVIEIDAASNRGIDEVRDLREKISFAPSRSKYKVYIIDEVHMMTEPAFNALLKTLEEPPAHAYFILATTEIYKVPETIISRCQRFNFRRITKKALMTRLSFISQKEEIAAEDTALELISRYVDGGLRDAIVLLEQMSVNNELKADYVQQVLGISGSGIMEKFYESLIISDLSVALNIIGELHSQGSDLRQFMHEFLDFLREKLIEHVAKDEKEQVAYILNMIETFQSIHGKLDISIPQLPLEMAVIKLIGNIPSAIASAIAPLPKKETKILKKEKIIEKDERKKDFPMENLEEDLVKNLPLTISYLNENWPRIMERIETPSLRMSLKSAAPVNVDDFNITLEFDTKFHRDKVMEHEHRTELESIIKEFFNKHVKIHSKIKEFEIKSMMEDKSAESDGNTTDDALKIFGGELME